MAGHLRQSGAIAVSLVVSTEGPGGLCMLQLGAPSVGPYRAVSYLVDAVALQRSGCLEAALVPLRQLLEDPRLLKVLHDGRQVAATLGRHHGIQLQGVLDTQVAASVLSGMGPLGPTLLPDGRPVMLPPSLPGGREGLLALLNIFGMYDERAAALAKLPVTDPREWDRRPLSVDMAAFASAAVSHLLPLAHHLRHALGPLAPLAEMLSAVHLAPPVVVDPAMRGLVPPGQAPDPYLVQMVAGGGAVAPGGAVSGPAWELVGLGGARFGLQLFECGEERGGTRFATNGARALADLLCSCCSSRDGGGLLVVGPPGCGKTALLADVARWLSANLGRHVASVDTSAVHGEDDTLQHGDVARSPAKAPRVAARKRLLEAVQNGNPEVVVCDEISESIEVTAMKVKAQQGVCLVAAVCEADLRAVINNTRLNHMLGISAGAAPWSKQGAGGAADANGGGVVRSQRRSAPAFECVVEVLGPGRCRVHRNTAASVDALLGGRRPPSELRSAGVEGFALVQFETAEAAQAAMQALGGASAGLAGVDLGAHGGDSGTALQGGGAGATSSGPNGAGGAGTELKLSDPCAGGLWLPQLMQKAALQRAVSAVAGHG